MTIVVFVDYVTRETIAHRSLDHIPRKGEEIHIEFSNLPPADFYVAKIRWGLLPNKNNQVTILLERAKGYD